jgi:aspartate/tyrosine/aromatic aminotransferase
MALSSGPRPILGLERPPSSPFNGLALSPDGGIYGVSARAGLAKQAGGDVVNVALGEAYNDDGKLMVNEAFAATLGSEGMRDSQGASIGKPSSGYGGITGTPAFKSILLTAALGKKNADRIETAATQQGREIVRFAASGGTGAINAIAFLNHSEPITGTPYWGGYNRTESQHGAKIQVFDLLTAEDGVFSLNIAGLIKKGQEQAHAGKPVEFLLNNPSQNPTGLSLSNEDWGQLTTFWNELLDEGHRVEVTFDLAYQDFTPEGLEKATEFIAELVENCPKLTIHIAWAGSKKLLQTGARLGGGITISAAESPLVGPGDAPYEHMVYGHLRAVGQPAHAPQKALVHALDQGLYQGVQRGIDEVRAIMVERSRILAEIAGNEGVDVVRGPGGKPVGGFMTFFPTFHRGIDGRNVAAAMEEDGVFTLGLAQGVRVVHAAMAIKDAPRIVESVRHRINEL